MSLLQKMRSGGVSIFWPIALLGGLSWLAQAQSLTIKEYPLPSAGTGQPTVITAGPDGALWFTESVGNKIGRITTNGAITEYTVPTANSYPLGITLGPDGALWFTEEWANKIGRLTPAGVFTEYPLPPDPIRFPYSIVAGPDGALWFTLNTNIAGSYGQIGRISVTGVITKYGGEASQFRPFYIATGPDGALWFSNAEHHNIGRITTDGVITFHDLGGDAGHITMGPDGALWFTSGCLHYPDNQPVIGRLAADGTVNRYYDDLPTCGQGASGITTGPDGALWYTRFYGNRIGRVTTAGAITVHNTPARGYASGPSGITAGPDGNIWFTYPGLHRIGVAILTEPPDMTEPVIVPQITGTTGNNGWYRSSVTVDWSLTDPESGISSSTGCTPTTLTADTPGVNLTCSATNGAGLSNSVSVTIKIDKTPPVISGMPSAGCALWPPNRRMVQVGIVTATDTLSGLAPGSLKVTGTSNERFDPKNLDIAIAPNGTGGFVVKLRADRFGNANHRIYTLAATANDLAGNTAAATAVCVVPHGQGK